MKIEVKDNCFPSKIIKKDGEVPRSSGKGNPKALRVTLADFRRCGGKTISLYGSDDDKHLSKNADNALIIEIKSVESEFEIQTENYLGKFKYQNIDFDIGSRFGESLLKRMLNFANDVYLDDVDVFGEKSDKQPDFSRFILYYLFVQSLEKAYLLGLPKSYQTVRYHEVCLKGSLDINRYIKHDIPYTGRLASVTREQHEVQDIIDTLHSAVTLVKKNGEAFVRNIRHVVPHLREARSSRYLTSRIMHAAINHKALMNPIFAPYKRVLRYAEYIIRMDNLHDSKDSKVQSMGFLINVAELFEIYITKLLQRAFPDWDVSSPKIELYEGFFYSRKIIPDIVMQRGKDVMVFDTKYKTMKYHGKSMYGMGDVDREDFFQINTYMSYYQQKGMRLICGGLLYPLSAEFESQKCHATHWLGNQATRFIVDGVELNENGDNFKEAEKEFISRIQAMINEYFARQSAAMVSVDLQAH